MGLLARLLCPHESSEKNDDSGLHHG
jgi:hypothetical protein